MLLFYCKIQHVGQFDSRIFDFDKNQVLRLQYAVTEKLDIRELPTESEVEIWIRTVCLHFLQTKVFLNVVTEMQIAGLSMWIGLH